MIHILFTISLTFRGSGDASESSTAGFDGVVVRMVSKGGAPPFNPPAEETAGNDKEVVPMRELNWVYLPEGHKAHDSGSDRGVSVPWSHLGSRGATLGTAGIFVELQNCFGACWAMPTQSGLTDSIGIHYPKEVLAIKDRIELARLLAIKKGVELEAQRRKTINRRRTQRQHVPGDSYVWETDLSPGMG